MAGVTGLRAQLVERIRAELDAKRLRRMRPRLEPQSLAREIADLRAAYTEYVESVSSPGMAASLQTSAYLLFLCRRLNAKTVLDLGSGFSSYVLRRHAQESDGVHVVSVDDSPEWMTRTAEFLQTQGLPDGDLVPWSEFQRRSWPPFDVVLHDLAGGELRESAMPLAAASVAVDGALILDDAHHDGHRRCMKRTGSEAGMTLFSLRKWTYDKFGRFAYLAVRT